MAHFKIPYELQAAIAKGIGLDPATLTRIVIDVPVDAAPRFRVSGYLTIDQCEQLTRVFEATSFQEVVS
jgi:hypothetical protein